MSKIVEALGPDGFGNYQVDWTGPEPKFTRVSKPAHGTLIPGFVDIHIHGGFGIDVMSASEKELLYLCNVLEGAGYEGFLATTVTASARAVQRALQHLPNHPAILGFHLEGPFISPDYPGAQSRASMEDPPTGPSDWDEIFADPRLRVITLAPERPNALQLISRLMQRGVIVSMGHTNATYDEARAGFEFGASQATHMFNAMRPLHHREAGIVGYALSSDAMKTELIYDRKHVSPDTTKLLFKVKGVDNVIAISDGTMATGMPPGTHIKMWGLDCTVGRGEVRLESGALAGSCITLLDAFRNLAEDFGVETAIRACCINPRRALRMSDKPRVYVELDSEYQVVERYETATV